MYQVILSIYTGELSNCIRRMSDGASIPFDPANSDYAEYLKWLEAGNAPLGADTPLPPEEN